MPSSPLAGPECDFPLAPRTEKFQVSDLRSVVKTKHNVQSNALPLNE